MRNGKVHDFGTIASMSAIETLDAMAADLNMVEYVPPQEHRRVRNGVHRLAVALLTGAIEEAEAPKPEFPCKVTRWARVRNEARTWLRQSQPCMSARLCCEALGIEYEGMMKRLEERWAAES